MSAKWSDYLSLQCPAMQNTDMLHIYLLYYLLFFLAISPSASAFKVGYIFLMKKNQSKSYKTLRFFLKKIAESFRFIVGPFRNWWYEWPFGSFVLFFFCPTSTWHISFNTTSPMVQCTRSMHLQTAALWEWKREDLIQGPPTELKAEVRFELGTYRGIKGFLQFNTI